MYLHDILEDMRFGKLDLVYQYRERMNQDTVSILSKPKWNSKDIEKAKSILRISNMLYNNTDRELLVLEDGVYDILLEKYKIYDPYFQVGSDMVTFSMHKNDSVSKSHISPAIMFMKQDDLDTMNNGIFINQLYNPGQYMDYRDLLCRHSNQAITNAPISKRTYTTTSMYPELIGSLDKCKFVLNKSATERGVFNDSNVKILERDFFEDHINKGIINRHDIYEILMELKYDGISVETECTDHVISARTRGDTGLGQTTDVTPILHGYKFPRSNFKDTIGVKFEAIIDRYNLNIFNNMKNYNYKNSRSAVVGLFGSSDAYRYRDLITLVPLQVDDSTFHNHPEIMGDAKREVDFLNKYFVTNDCPLRYSYLAGNIESLLRDINIFVTEADFMRSILPFMYDGVVLHYMHPIIRNILGRENHINKYSVAIKFNPIKKTTVFRGYTYSIGQNRTIVPMIHYDPVEFYGTIHNKSSGHSYGRFMELNLKPGDLIDVEYINDVMPYVYAIDCIQNRNNPNSPCIFPDKCPACGSLVEFSGSAKCTNINCESAKLARMVNMCAKLNMKGFGEATVVKLGAYTFRDMIDKCMSIDTLKRLGFGDIESSNMYSECMGILNAHIVDSILLGSLGFTNMSNKTWELIMSVIDIYELLSLPMDDIINRIANVKGIGSSTLHVLSTELPMFYDDIVFIHNHIPNLKHFQIASNTKKIRATGFRDKDLFSRLRSLGHDADDNGSLTKDTDILLVPFKGHISSKTRLAEKYGIMVIDIQEFVENQSKFLM